MRNVAIGIVLLCSVVFAGLGISIPFEIGRGDYALLYDQNDNFYCGTPASRYRDTMTKSAFTPWKYAKIIALTGGKYGSVVDTHYNCKLVAVYNNDKDEVVGYYIHIPEKVSITPYTPLQLSELNTEYEVIHIYNSLGREVGTITNQKFNMVHQLELAKGVYVAIGVLGNKFNEYKFKKE